MHKEKGTNIPAAWKTYRQALRDMTSQSDPQNAVWQRNHPKLFDKY